MPQPAIAAIAKTTMLPTTTVEQLNKATMMGGESPGSQHSTHNSSSGKLLLDTGIVSLAKPAASSKYPTGGQLLSEKDRKEQFQMFLGILIKYLGKKDPALQERAKEIVQECQAAYVKSGITSSNGIVLYLRIQSRLQEIITVKQWKRAQMYLQMHLKNKKDRAATLK
jgi:hypothetical protein